MSHRAIRRDLWPLGGLIVLLAACGGEAPVGTDAPSSWTVSESDSAGLRLISVAPTMPRGGAAMHSTIAENALPSGPDAVTVRGGEDGEGFTRLAGAVYRPDGRLVLADVASTALLLVDPDGVTRDTIGRRGQGPGEFRRLTAIAGASDGTIAVWDAASRRVTRIAANASAPRLVSPRAPTGLTVSRLIGADVTESWLWFDSTTPPGVGVLRGIRRIGAVDSTGRVRLVGEAVPGPETYRGDPGAGGMGMLAFSPLAAAPLAAHCGSATLIGDTHAADWHLRDDNGQRVARLTIALPATPLTDVDLRAELRASSPPGTEPSDEALEAVRRASRQQRLPIARAVSCGVDGGFLLELWTPPDTMRPVLTLDANAVPRAVTLFRPAERVLARDAIRWALAVSDSATGLSRVELRAVATGP